MKVLLLEYTPNPEQAVAMAARLCYSSTDIASLQDKMQSADTTAFLQKIMSLGHHSVLEHASFTFGIEGISRVTSHQLVRHRIASYSQQSQRYVDSGSNKMIIPSSIKSNRLAEAEFELALLSIEHAYKRMTELGIPAEDARYILPNATETKIIVTMNARELLNFFRHRCCYRAQWEIRKMAGYMLDICKDIAPNIFATAGAACVSGPCPEGSMSCGKPKRHCS